MELKEIKIAIDSALDVMDELKVSNTQLQQSVVAKQSVIDQQTASISELNNLVKDKENSLSQLQTELTEKNTIITQQQSQIAALEEKLASGNQQTIKELFFSKEKLSLQAFITKAQAADAIAIIDVDIADDTAIVINGHASIAGKKADGTRPILSSAAPIVFTLNEGDHHIENLEIRHRNLQAVAFNTTIKSNALWNNFLTNIKTSGGFKGYVSSRGGTQARKCVSFFSGCEFNTGQVAISCFSQDGPFKVLKIVNTSLSPANAHAIYAHPNVDLDFDAVNVLTVGSPGLALHHYSNGGGEDGKGAAPEASVVKIKNCKGVGAWQIEAPVNGRIELSNCNILLYEAPRTAMNAKDCTFKGGPLVGSAYNCGGAYRPQDGSVIENSTIDSIDLQEGGNVTFHNCTITAMMCVRKIDGAKPLHITLINSKVIGAKLSEAIDLQIEKDDASTIGSLWNWPIPTGAIKTVSKV